MNKNDMIKKYGVESILESKSDLHVFSDEGKMIQFMEEIQIGFKELDTMILEENNEVELLKLNQSMIREKIIIENNDLSGEELVNLLEPIMEAAKNNIFNRSLQFLERIIDVVIRLIIKAAAKIVGVERNLISNMKAIEEKIKKNVDSTSIILASPNLLALTGIYAALPVQAVFTTEAMLALIKGKTFHFSQSSTVHKNFTDEMNKTVTEFADKISDTIKGRDKVIIHGVRTYIDNKIKSAKEIKSTDYSSHDTYIAIGASISLLEDKHYDFAMNCNKNKELLKELKQEFKNNKGVTGNDDADYVMSNYKDYAAVTQILISTALKSAVVLTSASKKILKKLNSI